MSYRQTAREHRSKINFVQWKVKLHKEMMDLEGGFSFFGGPRPKWLIRGGKTFGRWNFVSKFRFHPKIFGGPILLPSTTPPGIAVIYHCRHLLICFTVCPRWALAASLAWFCILIVLLYLFVQLFASPWRNRIVQIHGEQLSSRQNLGPPLKDDTKRSKYGGEVIWWYKHTPPGSHRFPMKLGRLDQ